MTRRRRDTEIFSVSFLDVICCGFGAVILMFMTVKFAPPQALEASIRDLHKHIAALQQELFQLRGEARVLNRDLNARREQLSEADEYVARLQGDLTSIRGQFATTSSNSEEYENATGNLQQAKQRLTAEMQRLLGAQGRRSDTVGGIPVDSEYIIFVIDTSGSMFNYAWDRMQREMLHILDIYPKVKGVQVMSDQGEYMFPSYRGQWIPDTPSRRKAILQRMPTWNPFSLSSPAAGIIAAIRTYASPDKKISIYVLGDEFTGDSITEVADTVRRVNRVTASGERAVRIHAIGFPTVFSAPSNQWVTGIRFASLMRDLCWQNGGTFVALNDYR